MLREVKLKEDSSLSRRLGPFSSECSRVLNDRGKGFELKADIPNRIWYGLVACLALFTLSKLANSKSIT